MQKLENIIQIIIENTVKRHSKRPLDILSIARKIKEAENITGSLKKVAELVGLSEIMLKKFLSSLNTSKEMQSLIQSRKLDAVQIIYTINKLDPEEQLYIAKLVINKKLTTQDIKALVPIRHKLKDKNIEDVVDKLLKSKDIKVYVAFIKLNVVMSINKIKEKLSMIFAPDEIYSVSIEDKIGKIEFTKSGYSKLKELSKKNNNTIQQYLNSLING